MNYKNNMNFWKNKLHKEEILKRNQTVHQNPQKEKYQTKK